ncbi:hypothetical protein [Photobacterium leiognathi]|uniref:hypothetical protein n=1 Tax=Photobacterium leiognathi TaxID=553611 RepID=UPI00298223F2|nr:hypothetical protein [Photobacterium leiognathi]
MNSEDRALLDNVVALEGKDLTHLTKEEKRFSIPLKPVNMNLAFVLKWCQKHRWLM